jgi:hypothetical protein
MSVIGRLDDQVNEIIIKPVGAKAVAGKRRDAGQLYRERAGASRPAR